MATSIAPLASPPQDTAARCSCPRPRRSSLEIDLADLGEHRFKDLGAPERVYQLGDGEFPALKSLFRTNLPVPTTPFLGRERELAEVVGLLGKAHAC